MAANLALLRRRRGLSSYDVADHLARIGHVIAQSGVARIECGQRAVSVDDLVALAVVLGCSPNRLLFPVDPGPDEAVAASVRADGADLWAWACGERPLRLEGSPAPSRIDAAVFAIENRPHHAQDAR